MKLTKTQTRILEEAKHAIEVARKYKDFTDFFDNCPFSEQSKFTTAAHCNGAWNSAEAWKTKDPKRWAEMEKAYYDAINEQITFVYAKTESVAALERAGLIKIIEAASAKTGYAEIIKIL